MKQNKLHTFLFIVFFVLSIGISFGFFYLGDVFSEFKSLGLLGLFFINAISSVSFFSPGPAFLTVIAGGHFYPPLLVALVASMGSALGDTAGFIMGYSGRKILHNKLHKKFWFKVADGLFKKYGGWALFFFAFIPNLLFDSVGIFAGMFAYPIHKFFFIVLLGRFLRFLIFANFGSFF